MNHLYADNAALQPVCSHVRPVLLSRDPVTSAVIVDQKLCTGCGVCVKVCPFAAMRCDFRTKKPCRATSAVAARHARSDAPQEPFKCSVWEIEAL